MPTMAIIKSFVILLWNLAIMKSLVGDNDLIDIIVCIDIIVSIDSFMIEDIGTYISANSEQ